MDYSNMTIKDLGIKFKETENEIYFTYLFKKISPNLFNFIRKYVKDKDLTDAILNETMTKAYNKIHQYKTEYSISTWIYKIAYHLCLKSLNHSNKNVYMGNFSEIENQHNGEGEGGRFPGKLTAMNLIEQSKEDDIIEQEEWDERMQKYQDIVNLIDHTGEKYRDILRDNLVHNLTYRELEERHNVTKETVKCRLHRGKKMLKKMYNQKKEAAINE